MAKELIINNKAYSIEGVASNTPLLWVLRDHLNLTETKFGCGVAQCGACTVLVNGKAIRSCVTPVGSLGRAKITTAANKTDPILKKLQEAWIEEDVVQCGYCQTGQLMSATALLHANSKPTDAQIVSVMDGNICRCGTYNRIKDAIKKASEV
ncbi:MAG: (2Fe-2S)-binding protein [Campylobacterales bacterium]|nr:(2Fe-2S)-binding protein [Campylobacterales bacterium]